MDMGVHPMMRALWTASLLALSAVSGTASLPPVEEGPLDRRPEVTSQAEPEYPFSLARSGYKGEVLVDFIVDREGNVVRANVTRSTHPDFEAPAVEAVLKWKFKPGIKDGHPVFVHMQVPIYFQVDRLRDHPGGLELWKLPQTASKKLPPEFQYDEPPKPILTTAPVYPFDLLRSNTTGKASVRFAIDPLGGTHVIKLENASLPEFGAAACAMIESWRFEPATKGGQPCWALISKDQEFDKYGHDFPPNDSAERLLRAMKKDPCPIVTNAGELDERLKGRFQPSPTVPDSVAKANVKATALVEFVIDHAGHAQLPRIISATDTDFGWAAATAVARWQYNQPMKNGKPVDVIVQVPLVFTPKDPPAT
jgi:TonB family protein